MATLNKTVTEEGLFLSAEVLKQFNLLPGTEVAVTIDSKPISPLPDEIEQLIHETMGMLRDLPRMTEQLQRERREEDRLLDAKSLQW